MIGFRNIMSVLLNNKNSHAIILSNDNTKIFDYLYNNKFVNYKFIEYYNSNCKKDALMIESNELDKLLNKLKDFFILEKVFLFKNGSGVLHIKETKEKKYLEICEFDGSETDYFIINDTPISYKEKKIFTYPKNKSELPSDLVVECLYSNGWTKVKLIDIDERYDNFYKILMQHKKIRF